jgi:hypothetical protein
MTNQFPDATKMVLSPAAQAILNAYGRETGDIDCVWHPSELKGLAAALRAAAHQWKNEIRKQPSTEFIIGIKNCIDALNELADELEGQ